MMTVSTNGPTIVVDYVDRSYDDVCAEVARWEGDALAGEVMALVGAIERVAAHLAQVPMRAEGSGGELVADLRVIAVSTGHDPRTELLVVMPGTDPARARAVLGAVTARLGAARPLLAAG